VLLRETLNSKSWKKEPAIVTVLMTKNELLSKFNCHLL